MSNLKVPDLLHHQETTWSLYASEVRGKTLLRLWFNGQGRNKVTEAEAGTKMEDQIIYESLGSSPLAAQLAVEVYNTYVPKWV